MTKPKRKFRQPAWQVLINEYILFERRFRYETARSLDDCATNIEHVNEFNVFGGRAITGSVPHRNSDVVQFQITAGISTVRSDNRGRLESGSASLNGQAYIEDGRTVVSGKATTNGMAVMLMWVLIVLGGLVVSTQLLQDTNFFLVFAGGVSVVMLLKLYTTRKDRDYLISCLESAINDGQKQKKKKRD